MSLLEDIFLGDEADEARELERIIEGDEYDEKPRYRSDSDDDSEKEDEAEEEKKRVDPSSTKTKRVVKNPRFVLNPARLTGPRGIQVIPEHFKGFKFKGKGYEKEDLDLVLKKLEHWAYRLYPKFQFEDCLKKIETLGKKRPVMVHLHKIRSDQYSSEETVVQKDSSDDDTAPVEKEEDEFDKLLRQQIELAQSTPRPEITKKTISESSVISRPILSVSKATSSPSITDEQRERIMKNRKMAEERRLARLKNNSIISNNVVHESTLTSSIPETNKHADVCKDNEEVIMLEENITTTRKQKRANILDSSDEEQDGVNSVNVSIRVDVHTSAPETDKEVRTYSRHHKLDSHNINNIENETGSNEIEFLESEIINEKNEEQINDINEGNSMETESLVDNKEFEEQNTVNEREIDVENSHKKPESLESVTIIDINETDDNVDTGIFETNENVLTTGILETNENLVTTEILETNENVVKLDDKQNIKEVQTSNVNTLVNDDLDDMMDIDFSDDF